MKQEGLSYFTDVHWTIIAFFLFLMTFIGIFMWTYRTSAKRHYLKIAHLPLEESNNE